MISDNPYQPIRIGIVGLGFMAATHLKKYLQNPHARIAAICNPSGRNLDGDFSRITGNVGDARPLRLDMSGVKACRDFSELLRDPAIDVIDICTPTHTHREFVVAALHAGKHVLCEKPLARTSADAREIARAAASAKCCFMPAMCVRFWPEYVWVRQAIVKESFGKVLSARFRRVTEPPAWGHKFFLDGGLSGGALFDLHIHDTDFVLSCFGRPQLVYSSGYSVISSAIDHVTTHYRYESGSVVHAEGGWTMAKGFGFSASFTVNFERATVDFDSARGADALRVFENGKEPRSIPSDGTDGYDHKIAYFLECIRQNKKPSVVTAEDGVTALEICEAEEKSVRSGSVTKC